MDFCQIEARWGSIVRQGQERGRGKPKIVLICVHLHMCIHIYAQGAMDARRASNLFELEFQAIVSCLTWVLRSE